MAFLVSELLVLPVLAPSSWTGLSPPPPNSLSEVGLVTPAPQMLCVKNSQPFLSLPWCLVHVSFGVIAKFDLMVSIKC